MFGVWCGEYDEGDDAFDALSCRSRATTPDTSVLFSAWRRAAWGTAVRMEPKAHLGQSYNKQPDVDAYNIGTGGKRYSGDVKVVCPLTSSGEHGRKGAFVAFGNTEAFYRNMVVGHGPYCEEGEGGEGEGEGGGRGV